jgi:hypothetical protein
MRFSLEVIRARKGDCLMLHFGTAEEPGLVLIDGGPRGVYGPHLKPRLADLRRARKLGDNQPLPVDLLMVSHVDDDHIQGILDLTKEMVERQRAHQPLPVQVLDFWHNTFDNIIGNPPDELTAAFRSQFGAAALAGELPDDATLDAGDGELDEETIVSSLKVLASIEQGSQLRSDAALLGFPLNLEFDGRLIVAEEDGPAAEIAPDLTFTVLGPTVPELKKLHAKHDAWLKALKEQHKSPPAALAAYVDKSVPNLSSIVVLAEAQGKTVLLTGDARGDKILAGLEFVGRMKKGGTMHVDVLKVPHHGSANNLTQDFFERITAEHYVFSGNGEHGNPERETLEMLRAARGDDDFTVHLTYPIDELDVERAKDWRKEQAKEKAKKKKVRPNWSPRKNSLKSFCAAHKEFADKVSIVEEGEPHVIDLLDEVEF